MPRMLLKFTLQASLLCLVFVGGCQSTKYNTFAEGTIVRFEINPGAIIPFDDFKRRVVSAIGEEQLENKYTKNLLEDVNGMLRLIWTPVDMPDLEVVVRAQEAEVWLEFKRIPMTEEDEVFAIESKRRLIAGFPNAKITETRSKFRMKKVGRNKYSISGS